MYWTSICCSDIKILIILKFFTLNIDIDIDIEIEYKVVFVKDLLPKFVSNQIWCKWYMQRELENKNITRGKTWKTVTSLLFHFSDNSNFCLLCLDQNVEELYVTFDHPKRFHKNLFLDFFNIHWLIYTDKAILCDLNPVEFMNCCVQGKFSEVNFPDFVEKFIQN